MKPLSYRERSETMHPQRHPIRIIALDLDGTLFDDRGEISPLDQAALRRFHAQGGLVVLASGRMTAAIRPTGARLGIDGPIIAYNGAMVRDALARGNTVLLHQPLPARYADELVDYAHRERFHLNYYLDDVLHAWDDPELRRYADIYARQTGSIFHFAPDLRAFRGSSPTKIILITDRSVPGRYNPRGRDELYDLWQRRWGEEVRITRTNPNYLEFWNREVDKGTALAAIALHYGIPREETMAFGDARNDLPMLRWAEVGVAVANAEEEVKAAADYVSPFTNNESAVGRAIELLVEPC